MCGRYGFDAPPGEIADLFGAENAHSSLEDLSVLKPTDSAPVVVLDPDTSRRQLVPMQWGITPSWMLERSQRPRPLINARSETVHEKPSFRDAFAKRRCLVPASSFCEWKREGKQAIAHDISLNAHHPFAMAGIWEPPGKTRNQELPQFCILTTQPNSLIQPIHDRMPAILSVDDYTHWLSPTSTTTNLQALLKPFDPALMQANPLAQKQPQKAQLSLF